MAIEGMRRPRDTSRWLAIVNPAAGGGRAAARWPALARALDARGVAYDAVVTVAAGDAERIAADAVRDGARRFLAVGGDGTLHEIVNGLLSDDRGPAADPRDLNDARCVLAAAPLGTGNDWARALALPSDPESLADVIAAGATRAVDAGRIEYAEGDSRRTRWFLNVAGAGYDAWVVDRLPAHGPRGLAYLATLISGLWRYEPPAFRFATVASAADASDGSPFDVRARLFAAFAAIGPFCGGGMRFAPAAELADGRFDLVAVPHVGAWGAVGRLPHLYAGTLPRDVRVRYARSAAATIEATPPARVEADGQLLGWTPARLEIVPAAIDAVVPAKESAR